MREFAGCDRAAHRRVFWRSRIQPAKQSCRRSPTEQLRHDEARRIGRANAGEGIARGARQGHGRIGKRGR